MNSTTVQCTVGDFGQFFVLLELKVPRRQFHPRFQFFLAVLMLVYHTSLITFLRLSPNRFYPALKFGIYQKLDKIAKITLFRASLSLFRDKLGLSYGLFYVMGTNTHKIKYKSLKKLGEKGTLIFKGQKF